MEKVVALVLLAYAIGLLVGEALRERVSGGEGQGRGPHSSSWRATRGKRWHLYSGLFVLLRQKIRLGQAVLRQLLAEVREFFRRLVYADVQSHV